jgi:hypothetical protein
LWVPEDGTTAQDEEHLFGSEVNRSKIVSHPSAIGGSEWPSDVATVMQFRNGRVVSMRDYESEAEAIASLEQNS